MHHVRSREGVGTIDRKSRTRELLLDAAEACYLRSGVGGTTMEEIARLAGVTRMTLYRHLPSRDELVVEVLHRVWRREAATLAAAVAARPDPASRLTQLIAGYVQLLRDHRYLLELARDHAPAGWDLVDDRGFVARTFGVLARRWIAEDPGALRVGVDDTVDWLQRQVLLLVKTPMTPGLGRDDEVRREVEMFVVPGVLREPTNA